MKVSLLASGTRGDVQPLLALALRLQQEGHQPTLCAPKNFKKWIESFGVPAKPFRVDFQEILQNASTQKIVTGNIIKAFIKLRKQSDEIQQKMLEDMWEFCQNSEFLVIHPKCFAAVNIAELKGIPCVGMSPMPMFHATKEFPLPLTGKSFGGFLNKLSYKAVNLGYWKSHKLINAWRKNSLGLPAKSRFAPIWQVNGKQVQMLYAFSEAVIPRPKDWSKDAHVTGYWFLDQKEQKLSKDLLAFIKAGEAPVYIGFGSMTLSDPQGTAKVFQRALEKTQLRAVMSQGWAQLKALEKSPNIFVVDSAPHDQLFPLMSAVVHHGGAGTTAAGLRAGKPTLICPVLADQPFWGKQIHKRGLGPSPLPLKTLTEDSLVQAFKQIRSGQFDKKAQQASQKIAQEDGLENALQVMKKEGLG